MGKAGNQPFDIPLGLRLVRNQPRLNLDDDALWQMQDIVWDELERCWYVRPGHRQVCAYVPNNEGLPNEAEHPTDIVEQLMSDGTLRIVCIADLGVGNEGHVLIFNEETREWTDLGSAYALGMAGDGRSIVVTGDDVRGFGDGMVHHGPITNVVNKLFFGNIIVSPAVGTSNCKIVAVNSVVDLIFTEGDTADPSLGYTVGQTPNYAISFSYEGGEESPLIFTNSDGDSWIHRVVAAPWVNVYVGIAVRINGFESLTRRLKTINLYLFATPNYPKWTLIHQFNVWDTAGLSWTIAGGNATSNPIHSDYNSYSPLPKTHYQRTLIPNNLLVTPDVSPLRRFARIIGQIAQYWNLTVVAVNPSDDAGEKFDRLYSGHFSSTIFCPDVILPADYSGNVPIGIMGITDSRGYQVIIGSTDMKPAQLTGAVTAWDLSAQRQPIGCIARKSIAQTPDGPVFLGMDGIYQVSGLTANPEPYGKQFFRDIRNYDTLEQAMGCYSQRNGCYYLYIPEDTVNDLPHLMFAVDMSDPQKRCRRLTPPDGAPITAMGQGADGGVIVCVNKDTFVPNGSEICRLEDIYGYSDTNMVNPDPLIETKAFRTMPGVDGKDVPQKFAMIYRSSVKLTATSVEYDPNRDKTIEPSIPPVADDTYYDHRISVSTPAYAHGLRISKNGSWQDSAPLAVDVEIPPPPPGGVVGCQIAFKISRVWLWTQQHTRTLGKR